LVPVFAASYAANKIGPGVGSTGRVSNMGIRYAQNALYVAAMLTGRVAAKIPNAVYMAAWRVELPNATCDFVNRTYGHSTLTDFTATRHGECPGLPTAIDVVRTWVNAR
jgi:hypothetical protein